MTDIMIQGVHGRMGHALQDLIAQRDDCRIVAGVDVSACSDGPFPIFNGFDGVNVKADVLIDFSSVEGTKNAAAYCKKAGMPYVACTTGLDEEAMQMLQELSKTVPVFKSGNMSLGMNLLIELCKKASQILGTGYDVEIIEKHHHNKLDAPSGSALMLADGINSVNDNKYHYVFDRSPVHAKRDPNELGISAVRGGSIIGDHEVLFCGPDEVITLQHTAYSRSIFANGAVNAAIWLAEKAPGMYNMSNLITDR